MKKLAEPLCLQCLPELTLGIWGIILVGVDLQGSHLVGLPHLRAGGILHQANTNEHKCSNPDKNQDAERRSDYP